MVPSTSTPSTSTPSNYPSQGPSLGIITTVAGTGTASYSGDNGQATSAELNNLHGLDIDPAGTLECQIIHMYFSNYLSLH